MRSGTFSVGSVVEGHAVGRGEVEAEMHEVDASEAHCLLRVTQLQERRGEIREAQNDIAAAHLDEEFPVHDWCLQCMTAAVHL